VLLLNLLKVFTNCLFLSDFETPEVQMKANSSSFLSRPWAVLFNEIFLPSQGIHSIMFMNPIRRFSMGLNEGAGKDAIPMN